MTALAKLPEKWREEAADHDRHKDPLPASILRECADELEASLSPAELGDPVTADNAKAADSAALAMIGMGYAWDGVHWYQATPRAAEADWLPIESIPGDAKRVLVHTRLGECHVEYVTVLSGAIAAARMEDEPCFFTHWRPLPAPPAVTPPSAKGEGPQKPGPTGHIPWSKEVG